VLAVSSRYIKKSATSPRFRLDAGSEIRLPTRHRSLLFIVEVFCKNEVSPFELFLQSDKLWFSIDLSVDFGHAVFAMLAVVILDCLAEH